MGRKKNLKFIYKLHRFLGPFLAAHMLALSLTGTLLVWKEDLSAFGQIRPDAPAEEKSWHPAQSFEAIHENFVKNMPDKKVLALYPDDNNPEVYHLRFAGRDETKFRGAERLLYGSDGQNIVKSQNHSSINTFLDFVLRLHRELLLGGKGKLYVGLVGLLLIVCLMSGFVILRSFSKNQNVFNPQNGGARSQVSSRHKYAGLSVFGWALIVSVSGAFLALNGILIKGHFQTLLEKRNTGAPEKASNSLYQGPGSLLEKLAKHYPERVAGYVSYPDNEFSLPGRYIVLMEKKSRASETLLAIGNAVSGEIESVEELPWQLKALLWSEPLHFGDYGGLPLKIAWTAMGLLSVSLSLTGLKLFLARKKIMSFAPRKNLVSRRLPKSPAKKASVVFAAAAPIILLLGAYNFSGFFGKFFSFAALAASLLAGLKLIFLSKPKELL